MGAFIALVAVATTLGCSNPDIDSDAEAERVNNRPVQDTEVNDEAVALLPEEIRQAGRLRVGTNAPFAPYVYFASDNQTIKGIDIDVIEAVGRALDLDVEVSQQPFEGLVPGLQAGKFDVLVGGLTDNGQSRAESSFVTYMKDSDALVVPKDSVAEIGGNLELCGFRGGAQRGTIQIGLMKNLSDRCVEEGLNPIEVSVYPAFSDSQLAMSTGKLDFVATTVNNATDVLRQPGGENIELLPDADPLARGPEANARIAIATLPAARDLTKALALAVQGILDSTYYDELLASYGLEDSAVSEAVIGWSTSS